MANNTKRNAKGGGTIRKRADGRWEARFSMGFDPKTGKQIQKSVYGQTQKEVRQKLSAALTELDSGTYITPTSMKLAHGSINGCKPIPATSNRLPKALMKNTSGCISSHISEK